MTSTSTPRQSRSDTWTAMRYCPTGTGSSSRKVSHYLGGKMGVVKTSRRPKETDEEYSKRLEQEHWPKVEENEQKLLEARAAHRRRMGREDTDWDDTP